MSKPVDDKADLQNHPEAWAPPLLLAFLASNGNIDTLSSENRTQLDWARKAFNPGAYVSSAGSWNWQHMIGACLALAGDEFAIAWFRDLIKAQIGIDTPLNMIGNTIYFGGTEPISSTYEPFRLGSINSLLHLPETVIDHSLIYRYNTTLACLLVLGAVPWYDSANHISGHGDPYYTGYTVSPVGERTTPAHAYQSDLGPFLTYVCSAGFVSKREDWPMQVVRQYTDVGASMPIRSSCLDIILSSDGRMISSSLNTVLLALSNIRLLSRIEWIRYPEGVLTFSGPRLNGNTPKIFWSWSDNTTHTLTYGFPWNPDQHRGKGASKASGVCEIRDVEGLDYKQQIFCTADNGFDQSKGLPSSAPIYHVVGDQSGIRQVA